jgi:hypothetical protein
MTYRIIDSPSEKKEHEEHGKRFDSMFGRPLYNDGTLPFQLPGLREMKALKSVCPSLRLPTWEEKRDVLHHTVYCKASYRARNRPVFVENPEHPVIMDFVMVMVTDPMWHKCDICWGGGCNMCNNSGSKWGCLSVCVTVDEDDWVWLTLGTHSNTWPSNYPYTGFFLEGVMYLKCDQHRGLLDALASKKVREVIARHTTKA